MSWNKTIVQSSAGLEPCRDSDRSTLLGEPFRASRPFDRYCSGFQDVVVTIPRGSEPWLRRACLPQVGRIEFCRDYRDDYLGQQATKLHAETFTDADFISHVDADCIFVRPASPEDF